MQSPAAAQGAPPLAVPAAQAVAPRSRVRSVLVYLRTMALFVLVWAVAAHLVGNPVLLPSPWATLLAVIELMRGMELFEHAGISLTRMFTSLLIATALAVPLGLAMGLDRRLEAVVDPTVEVLRPISGIAWIPLALFIFGIGNTLPVFIMTYAAFFPLLLGTIEGVRTVDRRFIDAARTMGVPRSRIVSHVVLPAALPTLLVALRLGIAASWTAVVAAELIGAPSGLGYAIEWYRGLLMTAHVIAFIATIGVLGYLTDRAVRFASATLTPWSAETRALQ